MIKRLIIISVMVLIIFIALSEHETWFDRAINPQIDKAKGAVSDVQLKIENYVQTKKETYREKINSQIDRIQDRIEAFKISRRDESPAQDEAEKSDSQSPAKNHL